MDTETKEAVTEIVTNTVYNEIVKLIGWEYTNYIEDSQQLEDLYQKGNLIELRVKENNRILAIFKPDRLVNLYIWYLTRIVENTDLKDGLYTELVCTITKFKTLLNTGGNSYGSN